MTQGDLVIRVLWSFALACLISIGLASFAGAQQTSSLPRVGVLLVTASVDGKEARAFRQGLQELGYAEGRDVAIEWRSADGDYKKIPGLAADLVQRKVDVIVVDSTPGTRAVKRATSNIPIVMALVADPVGSGLVKELVHPGENLTGLSMMYADINAKRLQLLKEAIPRLSRVAVLWNPDNPYHHNVVSDLKAEALSLSIELRFVSARMFEEFGRAFGDVSAAHAQALYVIDDAQFFVHRTTLVKLASKARVPIISSVRQYPDEGGMMSYGANFGDLFRRSAGYVDRILKGAKPGDLPIEQPTKFELVVNVKAAKALGLTLPESILLRADEVIR